MTNLCPCTICTYTYSKLAKHINAIQSMTAEDGGLQNNLEGNINEDDEPKINLPRGGASSNQQNIYDRLTSDDYLNSMMKATMKQQNISHESQIHIAENFTKVYFVNFFKKFDMTNIKETTKDVEEFAKCLEELENRDTTE